MSLESTAAALPPEAQFSIRGTLSTSLAVFGRNLLPFLTVAAVVSLPYFLIQTWFDQRAIQAGDSGLGGEGLLALGLQTMTFGLLQAVLTYGTIQDLRGQPAGIGDCFRGGFAQTGEVLGGALIYGLMLGVATMLFIIPGILVYLRYWVFIPAMVIEKRKTGASFARSVALTAGRRWAILGLAAIVFVSQLAIVIAVILLLPIDSLLANIAVTLLVVLFSTFSSVVAAVGYYHLRAEKEGVLIDDIARVFD
ncbi:hypothetical protein [Dongia sp. agr-C8]